MKRRPPAATLQAPPPPAVLTLQIQVLGAHGGLRGDLGVDLDRVQVVGVARDVHIVPVVVVERAVGVALDEVSAVAQVGDVVQVSAVGQNKGMGVQMMNTSMSPVDQSQTPSIPSGFPKWKRTNLKRAARLKCVVFRSFESQH